MARPTNVGATTYHHLADDDVVVMRAALLAWYDASARDLPWRGSGDPYAVWISEVMAQQTRIETVVPYYERWIRRFPDVARLADADINHVLAEWEGLGYYSRARNLHSAARLIRERHDSALPSTYAALRELPGVGDYTAGAVSSIAFGEAVPAVDGNVRRVLARILNDARPSVSTVKRIASALVPAERPGDFNQALMELGARVCTPRSPRCGHCPLHDQCAARKAGTQQDRPARKPKQRVNAYDVATAVIRAPDGRVLLQKRADTGLLAGMWNFPGTVVEGVAPLEAAPAVARDIALRLGFVIDGEHGVAGVIEHTFSHRRERYICCVIDIASDVVSPSSPVPDSAGGVRWCGRDREGVTLPRAQQKIHAIAFP
ncbi:A/G-specific adenine glycosylase [soil metagenome]